MRQEKNDIKDPNYCCSLKENRERPKTCNYEGSMDKANTFGVHDESVKSGSSDEKGVGLISGKTWCGGWCSKDLSVSPRLRISAIQVH